MHFGIISPPVPGHLYPHCMLARELIWRGHQVTVFNTPDSEVFVRNLGVGYYVIGQKEFPLHSWHKDWKPALTGSNPWRDWRILEVHIQMADIMLRDLPVILKQQKVDALLVDQLDPQGASLAEYLDIPFITICSILPIHPDPSGTVPAALAWWAPTGKPLNRLINKASHRVAGFVAWHYMQTVNKWRKKWGLSAGKRLIDSFSPLAQLSVIPPAIDFPRPPFSPVFHAVGPFLEQRNHTPFPWDKLDGRPVVYASFGTIRNQISHVFDAIFQAFACRPHLQLVVSKGAWIGKGIQFASLPGSPLVVDYVPQLELLARTSLCITHAGPGTVLECAYLKVPMLALPVADDQPAMAARVKYHQLGEVIPWRKAQADTIGKMADTLLSNPRYKVACGKMSAVIRSMGGAKQAGDIIESVLS